MDMDSIDVHPFAKELLEELVARFDKKVISVLEDPYIAIRMKHLEALGYQFIPLRAYRNLTDDEMIINDAERQLTLLP